jgi:peptidylprolyl isomerase
MRRALIPLLTLATVLAACGDDETSSTEDSTEEADCTYEPGGEDAETPEGVESSDLADVEVTGEGGEEPTLEFPMPFGVSETTRDLLEEGDGEPVVDGASVTVDYVVVNGRTGGVLESSHAGEPAKISYAETLMLGVYKALDCVPAGSQVLVAIAPDDAPPANAEAGVEETDTLLMVVDVLEVSIPLTRAEGEAVEPEDGLPTVELAEDGAPTITVPDEDPPEELVVQPLIIGEGADVEAEQTITVHYTGVLWDTGEVFDSSWTRGTPAPFSIGTGAVIPGWDAGLVGQPVGSQVLLVTPPEYGYGEQGSGESIPPDSTLVFVVDILDAS